MMDTLGMLLKAQFPIMTRVVVSLLLSIHPNQPIHNGKKDQEQFFKTSNEIKPLKLNMTMLLL